MKASRCGGTANRALPRSHSPWSRAEREGERRKSGNRRLPPAPVSFLSQCLWNCCRWGDYTRTCSLSCQPLLSSRRPLRAEQCCVDWGAGNSSWPHGAQCQTVAHFGMILCGRAEPKEPRAILTWWNVCVKVQQVIWRRERERRQPSTACSTSDDTEAVVHYARVLEETRAKSTLKASLTKTRGGGAGF